MCDAILSLRRNTELLNGVLFLRIGKCRRVYTEKGKVSGLCVREQKWSKIYVILEYRNQSSLTIYLQTTCVFTQHSVPNISHQRYIKRYSFHESRRLGFTEQDTTWGVYEHNSQSSRSFTAGKFDKCLPMLSVVYLSCLFTKLQI
jgi:hypothetical protein